MTMSPFFRACTASLMEEKLFIIQWNIGVLEYWIASIFTTNIPLFQYSSVNPFKPAD